MATPGRTARKPTLETVAARAGVSKSLVSLVLRNSPKVSSASREAVMRAVAELGYRPNAAARLLAERQSHTIGVLLNDLRQPWFADMLDGLTPALHAGGKHILLGDGRIDRMLDETLTWSFIDLGVDGLVLAGSIPMSQAIIDAASQIPTVAVGGRGLDVDLPRADILANDNHLGGTLAVRHLIELGHTRIAHIHGLPSVAGQLRMQGYEDTMRAAGLGACVRIEAGDMSEEGGYRATVRLLSGQDRPTAIFAANDLTCVGALSAAAALGVRVPGSSPWSASTTPSSPACARCGSPASTRPRSSWDSGPPGCCWRASSGPTRPARPCSCLRGWRCGVQAALPRPRKGSSPLPPGKNRWNVERIFTRMESLLGGDLQPPAGS